MAEDIGILDFDLKGVIKEKTGEFANEDNESFIQNILYMLQDVNVIRTKRPHLGQFVRMRIKNEKTKYDVTVGSTSIKIKKYN